MLYYIRVHHITIYYVPLHISDTLDTTHVHSMRHPTWNAQKPQNDQKVKTEGIMRFSLDFIPVV